MSLFDVTMDGVQFPLIYYFFIGYFINKKRLNLVPHATLSIEAKNMQK